MIDILKELMPDGLTIKSIKEFSTKYKIVFEFENNKTTADLGKSLYAWM